MMNNGINISNGGVKTAVSINTTEDELNQFFLANRNITAQSVADLQSQLGRPLTLEEKLKWMSVGVYDVNTAASQTKPAETYQVSNIGYSDVALSPANVARDSVTVPQTINKIDPNTFIFTPTPPKTTPTIVKPTEPIQDLIKPDISDTLITPNGSVIPVIAPSTITGNLQTIGGKLNGQNDTPLSSLSEGTTISIKYPDSPGLITAKEPAITVSTPVHVDPGIPVTTPSQSNNTSTLDTFLKNIPDWSIPVISLIALYFLFKYFR